MNKLSNRKPYQEICDTVKANFHQSRYPPGFEENGKTLASSCAADYMEAEFWQKLIAVPLE